MTQSKINKPQIRFKEYEDDWEIVNFKDITTPSGVKNRENLPLKSYSISNTLGFVPQNEQFENGGTMTNADKTMYYIVSPNSFAYNPARINVGSIGYYDLKDNVIVSSLYVVFKTDEKSDDTFFWYWFKSDKFQKLIESYQEGGVRLYFFYDKLCKCTTFRPSIKEQKQIGNFIKHIDSIITNRQKKLESLKNLKNACLVKMFPQNGSVEPELRFKGFSEKWEEKPLNAFLETSTEKNWDNRFTKEDVLSVSGEYGIVNQIEFKGRSFAGASVSNYGVVKNGDIVYTKSPLNTNPYGIIKTNKGKDGIVSTLYAIYKPKENTCPDFVQCYFELNSRVNNYLRPLCNKGAKNDMKVSSNNALLGLVKFPQIEEQKMIANFFFKLDKLITIKEKELEKVLTLKKSCLEKLYV